MTSLIAGLASFVTGVWLLADLPLHDPFWPLMFGWVLLGVGVSIAAPALLDLFDEVEQ